MNINPSEKGKQNILFRTRYSSSDYTQLRQKHGTHVVQMCIAFFPASSRFLFFSFSSEFKSLSYKHLEGTKVHLYARYSH